jgi:hypothetical protein
VVSLSAIVEVWQRSLQDRVRYQQIEPTSLAI